MSHEQDTILCEEYATREKTNLIKVSESLQPDKRRFFYAAYASFRALDNKIEDMTGPSPQESHEKTLSSWLELCQAAYEDRELHTQSGSDWFDLGHIFKELRWGFQNFDIDLEFWKNMHEAMTMDANSQPMRRWTDFENYCIGSTVAPTAIFLYILLAKKENEKWTVADYDTDSLEDLATEVGTFCYLVHIIRDLLCDAAGGENLLTLPDRVIKTANTSKPELCEIAKKSSLGQQALTAEEKQKFLSLITILLKRCDQYRDEAIKKMDALHSELDEYASIALKRLFSVYKMIYLKIKAHPEHLFRKEGFLTEEDRSSLLSDGSNTQSRRATRDLSPEETLLEALRITEEGVMLLADSLQLIPSVFKSVIDTAKKLKF